MNSIPIEYLVTALTVLASSVIALLSLIVSKEIKVSEFRQEWINELRLDISLFISNLNAMFNVKQVAWENDTDLIEHLNPIIANASGAQSRIILRLNPNERESKFVLEVIQEMEDHIHRDKEHDFNQFNRQVDKLNSRTNDLLKFEWNRVKQGESIFKTTKWLAWAGLGVAAIFFMAMLLNYLTCSACKL